MRFPVLSQYDPVTRSEGSLDPLGMYPIADRMGVRLAPGIRERQLHPLFLTAIAACAHICAEFDEDTVAHDGVSKPWQVCEWYVVEGIVRSAGNDADLRGLPGRQKAQTAIDSGYGLSAARYLKTPAVFGFHGVYRLLARTLGVVDAYERLEANGYELLVVWEAEQQMPGFVTGTEGAGRRLLTSIRDAVEDGLEAGRTDRSGGWSGWSNVYEHLRHTRSPDREAKLIWQWLTGGESVLLSEIYRFLLAPEGRAVLAATDGNEQAFHRYVRQHCSVGLREILDAILAYERFCRGLDDAFYATLYALSDRGLGMKPLDIAGHPALARASAETPLRYRNAAETLEVIGLGGEFERAFIVFQDELSAVGWCEVLMAHHESIQRTKPPGGKLPWIERLADGRVFVRPPYVQESDREPAADSGYVHFYRTNSLLSFARDLGEITADGVYGG